MNESFHLEQPELFTAGVIGEPGNRAFFIQARQLQQLVTLKVEKEQLRALTGFIATLLQDVSRPGHLPEGDELAMQDFLEPAWIVGPIGVDYDVDDDRFIVVCEQATFSEDVADLDAPAATATFHVTREQIAAFIIRITELVEAGRPPCPLCGYPLDPRGHACPRTNGNSQPLV